MTQSPRLLLAACALSLMAAFARAAPLPVTHYAMPNGDGTASNGAFNYWDRAYTGAGDTTVDGAALGGGLGKLTDGIVSAQRWDAVSNAAGTGEYVGWIRSTTPDPILVFTFGGSVLIDTIDIALDNSQFGGVFAPAAILIDGLSRAFAAPAIGTVGTVSFTGLDLVGDRHTIQFVQDGSSWTFVSEIAFDGTPLALQVPEPDAFALLGLGALIAFGLTRGRGRITR